MGLESMIDSDPDEFEGEGDEEEEEDDSNQFFDAGANRSSFSLSGKSVQSKDKASEADTEDDPIDPITPGPHSRMTFEEEYVSSALTKSNKDASGEGTAGDNEGDDDEDDDDWVVPTPSIESPQGSSQTPLPAHNKSVSSVSSMSRAPSQDNGGSSSKKVRSPSSSQIGTVPSSAKKSSRTKAKQQEHFPFPVSPDSPPVSTSSVDSFTSSISGNAPETPASNGLNGKRMNVQRARDGGRTQSGGVKGILTEP
jgi:cysteine protease ATG4